MGALVSNGKAHRKQNSVKGRTVLRALDSSLVSQHWPRGSFCGSSGERESDLLSSPCGKRAAKGKTNIAPCCSTSQDLHRFGTQATDSNIYRNQAEGTNG